MPALDPLKKAAIYAMSLADEGGDIARVVDDWGWKGGKPGEISGMDYIKAWQAADRAGNNAVVKAGFKKYDTSPVPDDIYWSTVYEQLGDLPEKFAAQINPSSRKLGVQELSPSLPDSMAVVASPFAKLERAGVPRRYTGKLFKPLQSYVKNTGGDFITPTLANEVSSTLAKLTDEQRIEFINELPNWYDSVQSLSDFVRNV